MWSDPDQFLSPLAVWYLVFWAIGSIHANGLQLTEKGENAAVFVGLFGLVLPGLLWLWQLFAAVASVRKFNLALSRQYSR